MKQRQKMRRKGKRRDEQSREEREETERKGEERAISEQAEANSVREEDRNGLEAQELSGVGWVFCRCALNEGQRDGERARRAWNKRAREESKHALESGNAGSDHAGLAPSLTALSAPRGLANNKQNPLRDIPDGRKKTTKK